MPQSRSANNIDAFAITPENQLLTTVDSSKFVINDMGGACYSSGFKRFAFDIGAGDTKVFSAGDYNSPVIIWNNNDDLSLNQYKVFNSFNDQDNKNFAPWGWIYFKTDNEGMMWLGTVSGVVSMNPSEAFNDDFRINRITYNRSEGYDVKGVLCEGLQVNYIDVDANNNKWVATNTSGVFYVSPDGSEVYKHFDTTNSPLPS